MILFREAAAVLCLAASLAAADPDPVDLGRRSARALVANRKLRGQYTFREYHVQRELDSNGKETERSTETWDWIGLEGSIYKKLVMRNDRPLSAKEQKHEDDQERKEAERRRKAKDGRRGPRIFTLNYTYQMPYEKLVDVFDLRYLREDTANGRKVWVVSAVYKPGFRPATEAEKESQNYRFEIWMDQEECFPARIDAEIVGDRSRLQKGTFLRQDDMKLTDGTWVTQSSRVRYSAKLLKAFTVRGESLRTYSGYRKFQVDSRIVEEAGKL